MFKLIGTIIRFVVFILILAVIFHSWTAKLLLSTGLGIALGVPVKVEEVKVNFHDASVLFGGIEIGNPSSFFSNEPLAKIQKIFIDLAISSLWEKKIHFETIELNIQHLHVIREKDGKVNLLSLKTLDRGGPKQAPPQESGKPPRFQVDQLVLSLGHARYTDLTGPSPIERGFDMRMDHAIYYNIDGIGGIVKLVSWETLKRVGLGSLTGFLGGWDSDWGSSGNFFDRALETIRQNF